MINHGASIKNLSQDLPFLFKEVGMAVHFQELTGVSLIDSFLTNVDKKGPSLLNFFTCIDAQKQKRVLDSLLKIQTDSGQSTGFSEEAIQMVLLLHILARTKSTCSISLRRRVSQRKFGWRVCHQHPAYSLW